MSSLSQVPQLFESCEPRDDVLEGGLEEQQFAASLSGVAHNPEDTPNIYSDSEDFFDKTYPTDGLKEILSILSNRFLRSHGVREGESKNSILCLSTAFGGGKTHNMIASYHFAKNPLSADVSKFIGADLSEDYKQAFKDGLGVNTSVIVGSDIDSKEARSDYTNKDPDHPKTKTIWGELAYQLYGTEGYRLLEEYDQDQQAPGKNPLVRLFQLDDSPSLILIDEIADYLAKASAEDVGSDSTLGEQTTTFFSALFDAVTEVDDVTVIYSIADTTFTERAEAIEEETKEKAEEINELGTRQHKYITPTENEEVGTVLRHRLFEDVDDEISKKVADEYYQLYQDTPRPLPNSVLDTSYRDQIEREYPFHPELLETLTGKVDSISKFQKTRGALKLLARVIHHLWNNKPEEYDRHLIRMYDLTPADTGIRAELRETFFEFVDLDPAVKNDIYTEDGDSHAQLEDERWLGKGHPALGSHICSTVLWNSLVYGEQATGVTRADLYANLIHPQINFSNYDDALDRLTSIGETGCHFLYDEERIKFKSEPNLNRIIKERVDNTPLAQAKDKFNRVLDAIKGGGQLNVHKYPEGPEDVPDDPRTPNLCVPHYDTVKIDLESEDGEPPDKIQNLYEKTATKAGGRTQKRTYKNYVMFLCADAENFESAIETATRFEAINTLLNDSEASADLSDDQLDDLKDQRDTTTNMLSEAVSNVYRHFFYVGDDGNLKRITINPTESGGGKNLDEAVLDAMDDMNRLIRGNDGAKGEIWFKQKLWQETRNRMSTQDLIEQFGKKPGLPLLLDSSPLRKTVARMVSDSGYAYWDGSSEKGYWNGDGEVDWNLEGEPSDAKNLSQSISSSNVTIGEDQYLYEDVDSLLDKHSGQIEVEIPDEDEDEDGEGEDEEDDTSGGENGGITVSEWDTTTDAVDSHRAFSEARAEGISKAEDGEDAGLTKLTIDVEETENVIQRAKFYLLKQIDILEEDYNDETTVEMKYNAGGEVDGKRVDYRTTFEGSIEAFRLVDDSPEKISDETDEKRVEVKFNIELPEPEALTEEETDILANLMEEFDEETFRIQVEAEGVTAVMEEE